MATHRSDTLISAPALADAPGGGSLAGVWRRLVALADGFSHWCRRVRAYQELTALDARALHETAARPGALDRLVDGEVPRARR